MKYNCDIVRDLMPLYIDGIASGQSRQMVDGHLSECKDCTELFSLMKNDELETKIIEEKTDVITRQQRVFKRKSALIGGVLSGIFMIPILVCLIVNLATGAGLTWFFIVLASLLTAASLTVVPLTVPSYKLPWTLGTFTLSLLLLLGVCCIYTGGTWFFVAGSSAVFGIGLIFLPFTVRSLPVSGVLKNQKALTVMTADTVLFVLMMLSIGLYTKAPDFFGISAAVSLPIMALSWVIFVIIRYAGKNGWIKAGICTAVCGTFVFFADSIINRLLGAPFALPIFSPLSWSLGTADGNVKWLSLIAGVLFGIIFIAIGLIRGRKNK